MPPDTNPQTDMLSLIMNLRVDLARVEERQKSQGETTTKALQENTQALKTLSDKLEQWQSRTSRVEDQVADLTNCLETVRGDLAEHKQEHAAQRKTELEENAKRKFFLFQQKISAAQAFVIMVVSITLGLLSNVVGAAILHALGLKP